MWLNSRLLKDVSKPTGCQTDEILGLRIGRAALLAGGEVLELAV